jgi:hypothetical protein
MMPMGGGLVLQQLSQQVQQLVNGTAARIELEQAAPIDQDISSIHALSPLSRSELQLQLPAMHGTEKQDILDHCRDTTKLVNQLASALKGLEAEMDGIRRENRNLRRTMAQGMPLESTAGTALQANIQGMQTSRPSSPSGDGSNPSVTLTAVPRIDEGLPPRIAHGLPLASAMASRDLHIRELEIAASQSTPSRHMSMPAMHAASPRFGQTPQPVSLLGSGGLVATPSPGRRMVLQGSGMRQDSPMAMGPLPSPPATEQRIRRYDRGPKALC